MKKTCLIPLLSIALVSNAQREKIWGDPHAVGKFGTETRLNQAYIKLMEQVTEFSNSASRNATHASEVRALFARNSSLLRGLYSKAGLEAPGAMNANKQPGRVSYFIHKTNFQLANKLNPAGGEMAKAVTAPFEKSWV